MITSLVVEEIGPGLSRVVAVSDEAAPVFRWFVDGVLFREGDRSGVLELAFGRQTVVEVFDQDGGEPERVSGSGVVLRWQAARNGDGVELAARYRVERWVDPNWVAVAEIGAGGGRLYELPVVAADEAVVRLRVVAVDGAGVEVVVLDRLALVVREPDVPAQTVAVEDGVVSVG